MSTKVAGHGKWVPTECLVRTGETKDQDWIGNKKLKSKSRNSKLEVTSNNINRRKFKRGNKIRKKLKKEKDSNN